MYKIIMSLKQGARGYYEMKSNILKAQRFKEFIDKGFIWMNCDLIEIMLPITNIWKFKLFFIDV